MRIGLLFDHDFDARAHARQERAGWRFDRAGFDLFSFPSNARLIGFDLERFAQRQAARARLSVLGGTGAPWPTCSPLLPGTKARAAPPVAFLARPGHQALPVALTAPAYWRPTRQPAAAPWSAPAPRRRCYDPRPI